MHRVSELKEKYDRVVVSFHWGRESVFYPSPEQQAFARYCIDEGASVVIGHHPHYVQGIEEYKQELIFYSLGHFNFWQFNMPTSYHHRFSCIANIILEKDRATYEMIPIMDDDNCYPRPITSPEGRSRFSTHIENISRPLASGVDKWWWWFGEIEKPYLLNNAGFFGRS